ncbi:2-carboxy-1,4-naphthoquinone phytyltransferase, chloroplastic isoform X2 [Morus notabilis]|uniref:2-carboxy-1,4-naphthoquinone phytyltransferase, chloroplastic isoform X2 n=1 Tax=Morus notabilis TaxID=981085 RepID=UPI000CED1E1A|nr:2-carboxy-1,4-naphthoquinone phytyltransferase, chloroplastic isoform X2 [Morus notabilis]
MAATFCNLSPGSGLKKLDENFPRQRFFKRSYPGSKSSSCDYAQNFHHRTYSRYLKTQLWNHYPRAFVDDQEDQSYTIHEADKEEDIPKATLIWRAIKLPIYSVALVPLTVGSAAAFFQTGIFSSGRYFVVLVSSVFIITWLNLSNDVYDFDTGADKNKKESVVNLIGSRTGTLVAACLLLALGFMLLTWTSIQAGNKRAILLLACAITCGYIYQCPPFRLSYQGLGEPLCFSAFGPFATSAFYLLQSSTSGIGQPLTGSILSASLLVGFTTTLILFCSHFHQTEGDLAVGKLSPLVRIGTERGAQVVKLAITALYLLTFGFGLSSKLPFTCILLCAFTLPMARLVVSYVEENHKDKQKIFMAKYYCVRLHTVFGAALAAGLVLARLLRRRQIPAAIILS